MNVLLRLRKGTPIDGMMPFKYILYLALLSNVKAHYSDDDDVTYATYADGLSDIYDRFSDWEQGSKSLVEKALNELSDEGLIDFDTEDDELVYLGELRGKRFFPFEVKSSLFDNANETLSTELKRYGKSRSVKDRSRSRYIREQIDRLVENGVDKMSPGDFTDLHGYLYEIYTGGEVYMLRNKTEHFQTNNMLKAYDKFTVFAIIVEATLHYDKYRKRGVPTITNVACMKDDVFRALTNTEGSKEYMRDESTSLTDGGF